MPYPRSLETTAWILLAILLGAAISNVRAQGVCRLDLARIDSLRQAAVAGRGGSVQSDAPPRSFTEKLAFGALRGYRATLSSLDARECQFFPSCSHFADDAIRRRGILAGSVMALDRLQRCHPRAYNYYPFDETRIRLYDPAAGGGEYPAIDPSTTPAPRSRAFAMGLSAVMPGAGQVYAGHPWDGFFSMIQTVAPAAFSYLNYRRDGAGSLRGAGHATLAACFYAGNVYGAGHTAASRRIGSRMGVFVVNPLRPFEGDPADPSEWYDAAIRRLGAGDVERAALGFREIRRRAGADLSQRAAYLEILAFAELGRWNEAEEPLEFFIEGCADAGDRRAALDARQFLLHRREQREDRARTARILSAIVPGSGQLREGKPGAAATALVVNAGLGYYAYRTTRTDSWGEFALFALPTFWRYYRGNVVTAGRLAASRDDRRDLEELRRLLGASPR